MFNLMNNLEGVRIITPTDLGLDFQTASIDSGTNLDDIDDDIDFSIAEGNQEGCKIERELPQNNFNIRTLTQDKIEEMKRNSNIEWIPRS